MTRFAEVLELPGMQQLVTNHVRELVPTVLLIGRPCETDRYRLRHWREATGTSSTLRSLRDLPVHSSEIDVDIDRFGIRFTAL